MPGSTPWKLMDKALDNPYSVSQFCHKSGAASSYAANFETLTPRTMQGTKAFQVLFPSVMTDFMTLQYNFI